MPHCAAWRGEAGASPRPKHARPFTPRSPWAEGASFNDFLSLLPAPRPIPLSRVKRVILHRSIYYTHLILLHFFLVDEKLTVWVEGMGWWWVGNVS